MQRSSVDLPLPLGPSRAVSEPSGTSIETSSRARKVAEVLGLRFYSDRHVLRGLLPLAKFIAKRVVSAMSARTSDAARRGFVESVNARRVERQSLCLAVIRPETTLTARTRRALAPVEAHA